MIIVSSGDLVFYGRRKNHVFLAFFFFTGILSALYLFSLSGAHISSLMRRCFFLSSSIVGMIGIDLLPFLLSALAVATSRHCIIYWILFGKAFVLTFVALGFFYGFPASGFPVRVLLMLTGTVSLPILYWFDFRLLSRGFQIGDNAFLFFLILNRCLDYYFISPSLCR